MSDRNHEPIFGSGIRKGFLITVGIGIGLLYSKFSAGLEDWESIWVSSGLMAVPLGFGGLYDVWMERRH